MLYAVSYEKTFSNKKEESQYQKALSRRLLSHGLKEEYGVALEALQLSYGPYGKPYFADFPAKFSLSHCPGLVCCLISGEEAGVDAERVRPYRDKTARRICTQEELDYLAASKDRDLAFTALWTLKESQMKLFGEGFHYGFQNAAFLFADGAFQPITPGLSVAQYFDFPGYVLSVCCRGELPGPVKAVREEELPSV